MLPIDPKMLYTAPYQSHTRSGQEDYARRGPEAGLNLEHLNCWTQDGIFDFQPPTTSTHSSFWLALPNAVFSMNPIWSSACLREATINPLFGWYAVAREIFLTRTHGLVPQGTQTAAPTSTSSYAVVTTRPAPKMAPPPPGATSTSVVPITPSKPTHTAIPFNFKTHVGSLVPGQGSNPTISHEGRVGSDDPPGLSQEPGQVVPAPPSNDEAGGLDPSFDPHQSLIDPPSSPSNIPTDQDHPAAIPSTEGASTDPPMSEPTAARGPSPDPVVIGGRPYTPNPDGFLIGGTTRTSSGRTIVAGGIPVSPGGREVVISGTLVSMDKSGHLIIGTHVVSVPSPQPPRISDPTLPPDPIFIGGRPYTPDPEGFVIDGTTTTSNGKMTVAGDISISPGGREVVISGTPVSMDKKGQLTIGTHVVSVPPPHPSDPSDPADPSDLSDPSDPFDPSDRSDSPDPADPNNPSNPNSSPDPSSDPHDPPPPRPGNPIQIGSQTIQANPTGFTINGTPVRPGAPAITAADGTRISLGPSGVLHIGDGVTTLSLSQDRDGGRGGGGNGTRYAAGPTTGATGAGAGASSGGNLPSQFQGGAMRERRVVRLSSALEKVGVGWLVLWWWGWILWI